MVIKKLQPLKITVRYFAQARELAGTKEEELDFSGRVRVQDVVSKVIDAHPRLREMDQVTRIIVNGRMTLENMELNDGDVVVFMPPIAGGS